MSKVLDGKVAIITGGSRGLGAVLAATLADQGADIAITYAASADKAESVAEVVRAKGVRALAIRCDQADTSAAQPMVEQVVAELGKLDILINNAAIAVQGKLVDDPTLDSAAFDRQWMVNVLGTVAITRAAAQKISDGGRIVFIGSGLAPERSCRELPTTQEPRQQSQDMPAGCNVILAHATLPSTSSNLASCRPT